MKLAGNRPVSSLNELKTCENGLGGQNCLDFGTVRPRVQIPGPRPKSEMALGLDCHLRWLGRRRFVREYANQCRPGARSELAVGAAEVRLDSLGAQEELRGRLPVGSTTRYRDRDL